MPPWDIDLWVHVCYFGRGDMFVMSFSGILVPGGFGKRGTEGKIAAAEWGRKMKKPYLGR